MDGFDRRRRLLAIGLAGLAGFVDAVGFLSADGYFVSFMSGNTTRLGVDLVTRPDRAVVPALLITGFVAGVAGGAIIAARAGPRRKRAVLGLVALLLVAAALQGAAPGFVPLALLVTAMGTLNNTFLRDGTVSVGLTYMTGALVKLGQAIAASLLGQPRGDGVVHAALWGGLASGAVLGALAFAHLAGAALWLASGWAMLMLALAWRLEKGAATGFGT
ncbi:YoaK family protein [Novosphingobium sp.]|uniref:YoaK family protein n=1 Tax=Novosphingobium sp. TaxID=1874826 RepID=UPI002628D1F1|nr:YoaK family protein [Novosphingobium sp.]